MSVTRRLGSLVVVPVLAALAALLGPVGCMADVDFELRRGGTGDGGVSAAGSATGLPGVAVSGLDELSLLSWNVEWFQDPERGPVDDARQFDAALDVLASVRPSLAGLQEIAVPERLEALVARMPGYAFASSSYEWPQQTALLYRTEQFTAVDVRAIEGLDDAGRPPLAVQLLARDGSSWTVIVVHAKAGADAASWERRERFAAGLAERMAALDTSADAAAIALGDFNDAFTHSIVAGLPSPYAELPARSGYQAVTAALERGAEASTVWGDTVDHILLSAALAARVRSGSADVLRDELLARFPAFFDEVSDHAPVAVRLVP